MTHDQPAQNLMLDHLQLDIAIVQNAQLVWFLPMNTTATTGRTLLCS